MSTRPYIGGQAVIEGVMMRSPASLSIVCRRKSGELVVRETPMPEPKKGPRSWPFLRGVTSVVESLRMGSRALRWSAELYEKDYVDEDDPKPSKSGSHASLALSIVALATGTGEDPIVGEEGKGRGALAVIPILFAIVLFVMLPQGAAELVNWLFKLHLPVTSPGYQAITGVAKLAIIIGYMLFIRRVDVVRRVFQYHGAEHKAISTYESGQTLELANARAMTTLHPRCGTTFLVMVAMVSIVVFTILGAVLSTVFQIPEGHRLLVSVGFFLAKLPFLPLIASVTFEIQRLFARYCTTGPLRALLWPGFLVQKITTAEPDDAQMEIALASLQATLWREKATGAPKKEDRVFETYAELLADPGYASAA